MSLLNGGLNDDVQEKLIAKQDAIVAGANGYTKVTENKLCCRLHPPLISMPCKVAQDVEILGYCIPKDTIILCGYQAVKRDPAMYHDPNTLDIERFARNWKPPGMISFGTLGSPHYCVGAAMAKMMIKTTFSTLLRDYTYTLKPDQRTDYMKMPDHIPAFSEASEKNCVSINVQSFVSFSFDFMSSIHTYLENVSD